MKIAFHVNGRERSFEIEGEEKLVYLLREKLDLTGTKTGCRAGVCGSCVVVVDGKAVSSCVYPAKKLGGSHVLTIEGISDGRNLHPIQKAFVESGAIQCGFCTPGIIMRLYALFTRDIDASEAEILKVLDKHLCRCTGYEAIIEGTKLAQKYMKQADASRTAPDARSL